MHGSIEQVADATSHAVRAYPGQDGLVPQGARGVRAAADRRGDAAPQLPLRAVPARHPEPGAQHPLPAQLLRARRRALKGLLGAAHAEEAAHAHPRPAAPVGPARRHRLGCAH